MVDEPVGFREFVDAHSRALLRAAWLLTGDWAAAEDLVQTALAAAWPKWATITGLEQDLVDLLGERGARQLRSLLMKILSNPT